MTIVNIWFFYNDYSEYMVLEIIENFYDGSKEKIAEIINSIKNHIKSFGTGIIISIVSEIIIFIFYVRDILNSVLKNPYTNGLNYPTILINLLFALVIPVLFLVNKKFTIVQNFEELGKKFEMLNSIWDAISYTFGYFIVILCMYFILHNLFHARFLKYIYLLGITPSNLIIEIPSIVIILLVTYWLYSNKF